MLQFSRQGSTSCSGLKPVLFLFWGTKSTQIALCPPQFFFKMQLEHQSGVWKYDDTSFPGHPLHAPKMSFWWASNSESENKVDFQNVSHPFLVSFSFLSVWQNVHVLEVALTWCCLPSQIPVGSVVMATVTAEDSHFTGRQNGKGWKNPAVLQKFYVTLIYLRETLKKEGTLSPPRHLADPVQRNLLVPGNTEVV